MTPRRLHPTPPGSPPGGFFLTTTPEPMADLTKLSELHRRCTTPPSSMSLMERLDWEPDPEDVDALMAELKRLASETQKRALFTTCRHFERTWEWLPWEDLDGGARRCVKGEIASYLIARTKGRLVARNLGPWLYDHNTGGSVREKMSRLNPDPWPSLHGS